MRHPFQRVPAARQTRLLLRLMAAVAAFAGVMTLTALPFRDRAGIVAFELARTPEAARAILAQSDGGEVFQMRVQLWLDLPFPALYGATPGRRWRS